MKKIYTLILSIILLSSFSVANNVDAIVSSLKSGNAAGISKYFDATVDITLPEKSSSYSKSQAELILKDFFTRHEVKGFTVIHKGDNAGAKYCIGTLSTKTGDYRTTIYLKQKNDSQILQEIRFENK